MKDYSEKWKKDLLSAWFKRKYTGCWRAYIYPDKKIISSNHNYKNATENTQISSSLCEYWWNGTVYLQAISNIE